MGRTQQGEGTDRGVTPLLQEGWRVEVTTQRTSHRFRRLRILSGTTKLFSRPLKPSWSPGNTCPLLTDSSLSVCTHTATHTQNTVTLDYISHTDDFRAGRITEHICLSSIIIMNWTLANFHYRLSFRSICTPPPPRSFRGTFSI